MANNPAAIERFEVFFDGQCPLCKREMEMVRRKDKHQRLLLVDISAADFESTERTLDQLMREIHGRFSDGRFVVGVEVFREIYARIGFGAFVSASRWFGVRQMLNLGYRFFAFWRFKLAMRRMKNRKADCEPCNANECVVENDQP